MTKIAVLAAAALLAVAVPMVVRDVAAEDPSTVKVALTDMSASAGMGPMGQILMGPGYGGGQGMMGNGMMRPGYGWGTGMMGQAQGYGSGPGMMGMMAIRIDHDTVKAGSVKFDVTNWSRAIVHEVLIVAVDDANAALPYDYSKQKVIEDQVKVLGDTPDLQPNMSHTLDVPLTPGFYLLICNVPGHYAAGMATPLKVVP